MEKHSLNKYWRYSSKDDFYNDAVEYLTKHVLEYEEKIKYEDNDAKYKPIRSYIRDYKEIIRRQNCQRFHKQLFDIGAKIVCEDVDDWRLFSSSVSSSLKDITLRVLIGKEAKFNYVSVLLLSHNMKLTEDFIEDMIYMDSALFKFEDWDDEHVAAVTYCAANRIPYNESEEIRKLYPNKKLTTKIPAIRFNFNDYNGELSRDFLNKYRPYIKNDKLVASGL